MQHPSSNLLEVELLSSRGASPHFVAALSQLVSLPQRVSQLSQGADAALRALKSMRWKLATRSLSLLCRLMLLPVLTVADVSQLVV